MSTNFVLRETDEEPPGTVLRDKDEEPPGIFIIPSEQVKKAKTFRNGTINFPSTIRSDLFRQTYFPFVRTGEWNDWRWQLRNRITTIDHLGEILRLSEDELASCREFGKTLSLNITPYYLSLLDPFSPDSALRKSVVPTIYETFRSDRDMIDPLGEHDDTVVPGLVHRYPDRVLFLVTEFCSTYCRYCTRSRIVGRHKQIFGYEERWTKAIEYIRNNPVVRDVLISGGDPLTLPDSRLEWLLSNLRRIPHIEIIRIGTKIPAVMPMRVTTRLTSMLKKYHPLWMSLHFTHPDELTTETKEACSRLADAGIPLGSQTVLLKGINDDADVLMQLFRGLLAMRVRPYYLYQCDPVVGTSHLRTTVRKGLELYEKLRGFTSGYAVPTYVIDAPGGGGKIALLTDHVAGREGDDLLLRNFEGKIFRYPDPDGSIVSCRPTAAECE